MAKNTSVWGTETAKKRYAEGGRITPEEAYDKLGPMTRKNNDKPRVGPFPVDDQEKAAGNMPAGAQNSYRRPEGADDMDKMMMRKKGGPVPGSDSPPTVPSEWPPHPLKRRGGKV